MTQRFYGKHRGKVVNNVDPKQLGRVQVKVPDILGSGKMSWAMPCTPYAGKGVGFFALPPVGANVWVEFEGGNIDYPIWAGCFWGTGEVPAKPAIAETKVLKTDSITLQLSDMKGAGGLTLNIGAPGVSIPIKLTATSKGVELTLKASKVKMTPADIAISTGPAKLKLSGAAGSELKHGKASVKLQQLKVSINGNAFEVT